MCRPGLVFAFSGRPDIQPGSQCYVTGATGWGTHLGFLFLFIALSVRVHGCSPCVGLLLGSVAAFP